MNNAALKRNHIKELKTGIGPLPNGFLFILPVLVITILIYGRIRNHEFTNWDDPDVVVENMQIRDLSYEGLLHIFTPSENVNEYQPLTTLAYAINYHFFELNPAPYLITNLIFHLLNIILVFYLIIFLSKNHMLSFFVSLLFAVHPMQVEVVAWVSAQNYTLMFFFFMCSLLFYVKYIMHGLKNEYLLSAFIVFIPALLSKSTAVTLTLVLFCIDYIFERKIDRRLFLEKIPFLSLSIIFGFIALMPKVANFIDLQVVEGYNFFDRIFLGFYALSFYFIKLLIPVFLKVIYLYPEKTDGFFPLVIYLSIVFIFLLFLFLRFNRIEKRNIVFGVMYFILSLFFVLHFIPFWHSGMTADRYVYLGSPGFFYCIGLFIIFMIKRYQRGRIIIFSAISIYVTILIFQTYMRVGVWKDSISLWTEEIRTNPINAIAYNNRGNALSKKAFFEEAIKDYNEAIEINPEYAESFNNRANAKEQLGLLTEALVDYNKAIEYDPVYTSAYFNRGILDGKMGQAQMAISDFSKVIEMASCSEEVYFGRGVARADIGDYYGALSDYNQVLEINPNYAEAYNNRGIINSIFKNTDAAFNDFKLALDNNPEFTEAYLNLGLLLIENQQIEQGCQHLRKAQNLGAVNANELLELFCAHANP
ncbi:MAG: tetratricopeptide repeat protein [Bacteroidales bacterium]|nr:tetratricopeptide repeat protein [Bacteroidales bacterium]